jgi:hypothetical protein
MLIPRKRFLNWIIVGIVLACALVQGWILQHELMDCLPFKEMRWASYRAVATVAMVFGPIAAVVIAIALTKMASLVRQPISHTLAAGFISPLVFLLIYRLMTPVPGSNPDAPDFSTQAAWDSFAYHALIVVTAGLVVAGILLTAVMFFRPKAAQS